MKQFSAIFLAVLIGLTSSSSLFIWLTFEVAQPYVEEMWCVNKSRPEKQCHGKCFLHEQLQEQKEDNTKVPISIDETLKITVFYLASAEKPGLLFRKKKQIIFNHSDLTDQLFPSEYFHPPETHPC